jgi:hypothetical protein
MKRTFSIFAFVSLTVLFISVGAAETKLQRGPQGFSVAQNSQNIKIDAEYGKMPLYFIPNQGQIDKQVAYYVQGKDKTIYFTPCGITFALTQAPKFKGISGGLTHGKPIPKIRNAALRDEKADLGRWVVKLEFVGANENIEPVGVEGTGAVVSYFKGRPSEWKTGLPIYSQIVYRNLWPGIDLVYYGTVNRLKYEFIVHPGADPSRIRLAYRGADSVAVDNSGRLNVSTPAGSFQDGLPVAYQEINGKKDNVQLAYQIDGHLLDGKQGEQVFYGFRVGEYDHGVPLVLDPVILVYCGYIGGARDEYGLGIAVDDGGNAYVAGYTQSTEASFPVTVGPDLTFNGHEDAFIAKVNASGTGLVYCSYIGGSEDERAWGIAVDTSGNAYVTGNTFSTEATFPVVGGPDLTHNGNAPYASDAFVAKVNATGTGLIYCGYIGGDQDDYGQGIAVDGAGNAYVTGFTLSDQSTFPVTVGPDLTQNGQWDAFVAKINVAGTSLIYCGYIGGSESDYGYGVAVDMSGNAYVSGEAFSTEATFPVTVGPDLTFNGYEDGFIAKVNVSGTGITYCSYVGGEGEDYCLGIAVDGAGCAYVTGYTGSYQNTFPVVVGPDLAHNGVDDAFVAKVNASGTAFIYCGYIGGSDFDYGSGIVIDGAGNAYVIGFTDSTEATFPVTVGPDLTFNGFDTADAFIAKVNAAGTALIYCGYVGGSGGDYGMGIAVDGSGNAYVVGTTWTTDGTFPVTGGPDLTHNGFNDVFVAKISRWDVWTARHAVGDFDGDGDDEAALDFGALGVWIWDGGSWFQITTNNPENMVPIDIDGDGIDEIALDLGNQGLWLWNSGTLSLLNLNNAEFMIAADTDGNGTEELIIDYGTQGLWWRQENGYMNRITNFDAHNMVAIDIDGDGNKEIVVNFGLSGLWVWDSGVWSVLTSSNSISMVRANIYGDKDDGLASGIPPYGTWLWDSGMWAQLSGVPATNLISGHMVDGTGQQIAGDFRILGLWLWSVNGWNQLSGREVDYIIAADIDGDGNDEIVSDFDNLGLWLWDSGTWSQLTGVNPEYLLSGDFDGDSRKELIIDFGSLGVWMWNEGAWSQLTGVNPD